MSIGSFFSKVEAELKKLFGSTTVEQKIQSVISYVAPIVNTIISLADPAIAPFVAGVISTVQSDLATVSVVVQGAAVSAGSTAAQTVTSALNSVKANLAGLLASAEIKNSAKVSQITAATNLVIGEVDAALAGLAPAPAAAVAPAPVAAAPAASNVTVIGS